MGDSQLERSNSFKALCWAPPYSKLLLSGAAEMKWHLPILQTEVEKTKFERHSKAKKGLLKGCTERLLAGQGLSPAPQIANWIFSHGKIFYSCWTVKSVIVNNPEFFSSLTDFLFIWNMHCIPGWKPNVPQFLIHSFYFATYLPSLCIVFSKRISNLMQHLANWDTSITRGDHSGSALMVYMNASMENMNSPRSRAVGVWDYFQEPSLSIHQE